MKQVSPNHPPIRLTAAWVLAVSGRALLTLATLPLHSPLALDGFLFCMLLIVIAGATVTILIGELTRLAREQAALRRVATLVAGGAQAAVHQRRRQAAHEARSAGCPGCLQLAGMPEVQLAGSVDGRYR